MRKRSCAAAFVALASMGSASVVAATDGVVLYGSMEIGPEYDSIAYKGKKRTNFGLGNGVSKFGLRGTHAISGELSARFTLESGFTGTTGIGGGDRLFSRQASLGLLHKRLGALDVGRHYTFAALYESDVDPFEGGYALAGGDTVLGNGPRIDNLVLYRMPAMGGWEGGVGYSFGVDEVAFSAENARVQAERGQGNFFGSNKRNRLLTTGLKYSGGPLKMLATYDKMWRRQDAAGPRDGSTIEAYMVGGAYAFEPFTLYAAFSQTFGGWLSAKNMNDMPADNQGFRDFHFAKGFAASTGLLGAQFTTGPHRWMASWQAAKPKNARLTGHAKTFSMYSLGYRYALSKRTDLMAFLAYGTNYAFVDRLNGTQTSMRMQHRF